MPVEQSIHWKPLRDPHYVVASLQPADGGRRKIFVRQQVFAQVEALVRAHGRRTAGLLLGHLYQCSTTGADYLVVESISEHVIGDENEIAARITNALADRATDRAAHFFQSADQHTHVLGWYRGVHNVEAKPSLTTAGVHVSLFGEPWQMTLVVGEGSSPDGTFFLRDSVNACWFCAPFYELLSPAPAPNQPKATLVSWAQYITAEPVVPAERAAKPSPEQLGLADVPTTKRYERPWLRRSSTERNGVPPQPSPSSNLLGEALDAPPVSRDGPALADQPATGGPLADPPLADRPAPRSVEPGLADTPRPSRGVGSRRSGRSAEKLSIVDDRDQREGAPAGPRRVSDDDDTVMGDDPNRYIEIARAEGFFVAAKFDAAGGETLWVLNEPYSGMLLAVVAASSQVIDATLHYNLQTDDAGLRKAPFPEHRDPESKTIYVRETCMEALRARCRRLRATNALLREWRVTPTISFLTPGEWESIRVSDAPADRGIHVISDLNKARIAELPSGVQSQFHLSGGDATA